MPAAFSYPILPFYTKTGELPTPSVVNGVRDMVWPRWIYWFFFVYYSTNAFTVLFNTLAEESFFISIVFVSSNRFATITEILQLLNYEGERDRKKDQRIIRDGYLMHVEVLE